MDKQKLIDDIVNSMSPELTEEQLRHLENILIIKMHDVNVESKCTEIIISESGWDRIIRNYIACKRLENCSEGTLSGYQRCIRMMYMAIGKPIREISIDDLRFYLAKYQVERKISLSYMETLRHYITAFFTWANDEGYIDRNPARRLKKVKVPRKVMRPYSHAEIEKLHDHATCQRDLAIMEVLYASAVRVSELVSINRDDVKFSGGRAEIVVYGKKGKAERKVYLTEECCYHLKKYLASRNDADPALFVSVKEPHKRLSKEAIEAMLHKLGEKTGIHAHPHRFRRTFLTDGSRRGMPVQYLQKLAGHTKIDTTMVYVVVTDIETKSAYDQYVA